ncbi:hypothetical protein EJB05_39436, partial [Eragrostis curvula]
MSAPKKKGSLFETKVQFKLQPTTPGPGRSRDGGGGAAVPPRPPQVEYVRLHLAPRPAPPSAQPTPTVNKSPPSRLAPKEPRLRPPSPKEVDELNQKGQAKQKEDGVLKRASDHKFHHLLDDIDRISVPVKIVAGNTTCFCPPKDGPELSKVSQSAITHPKGTTNLQKEVSEQNQNGQTKGNEDLNLEISSSVPLKRLAGKRACVRPPRDFHDLTEVLKCSSAHTKKEVDYQNQKRQAKQKEDGHLERTYELDFHNLLDDINGASLPLTLGAGKRTRICPPRDSHELSEVSQSESAHPKNMPGTERHTFSSKSKLAGRNREISERLNSDKDKQCPDDTSDQDGNLTLGNFHSNKKCSLDKDTSEVVEPVRSSNQRDDGADTCTDTRRNFDKFIGRRKLTKTIDVPGTSTNYKISSASRMETRLILRRSLRSLYKLHKDGWCLGGSFSLRNFLIDDNLFISLQYRAEDRREFNRKGARADFQRFARMVRKEMFSSEDMPDEIRRWLERIERAGMDYEYLLSYDCSLMEHNQVMSTFMQLYAKLLRMERSDYLGYQFVLDHLQHFSGWSFEDLQNEFFTGTFWRRDPVTRNRGPAAYGSDVMSLLRLIRNTFQHIMLKTIESNGEIMFDEDQYEDILNDGFPGLLGDFMEAMYIVGYLADLNLEYVMI